MTMRVCGRESNDVPSGTSIKGKGGIDVTAHKRVRQTGISSLRKI